MKLTKYVWVNFVILKIVEIGGVVGGWWLLCLPGQAIDRWFYPEREPFPFWFSGLATLTLIGLAMIPTVLIGIFIKINWQKAKKMKRYE